MYIHTQKYKSFKTSPLKDKIIFYSIFLLCLNCVLYMKQTGSKSGKEYIKAVYLSPCLFNFYAEYIMGNAGLDKSQAGIKIAGGNINNFRYADDITLMADSEEELKILLMRIF